MLDHDYIMAMALQILNTVVNYNGTSGKFLKTKHKEKPYSQGHTIQIQGTEQL
jgi:hypothetical protein